jgi:hypothetical protein
MQTVFERIGLRLHLLIILVEILQHHPVGVELRG